MDRALLGLCAVALGFSIVYPTLRLAASALAGWQWDAVLQGAGRAAVLNTLFICFMSVFTSGLVGTSLAFFVARYSFPGRGALGALAYLPFALPPLAGTLSFYYLIGTDGLLPRWVHSIAGSLGASLTPVKQRPAQQPRLSRVYLDHTVQPWVSSEQWELHFDASVHFLPG